MVTISPSGVVPVCCGGQLELIRTTSTSLEWRFSLIRGNDTTPTEFACFILSTGSMDDFMSYLNLIVNSITFNYYVN